MNQNIVVFKGRKNGITILLDPNADFSDIEAALADKVLDAKNFFGGAKASILFQGRILNETEEVRLVNIIAKKANLDISFITIETSNDDEIPPSKGPSSSKKLSSLDNFGQNQKLPPEHTTKFQTGSLRSGQAIHFSGSVVILGDVNPGAEIIAEGNIIILGVLKGLVHAGCSGNRDCFVSATLMKPTQLRIADIITYIPDVDKKNKKETQPIASYAYIKEGQIYIAPLVDI